MFVSIITGLSLTRLVFTGYRQSYLPHRTRSAKCLLHTCTVVPLAKELHFILINKFILEINSALYKKDCLLSVLSSQI